MVKERKGEGASCYVVGRKRVEWGVSNMKNIVEGGKGRGQLHFSAKKKEKRRRGRGKVFH